MEELTELQFTLAEGLADLSRRGLTPTEVEPTTELDASSISFVNGSWRASLLAVAGWLRLENNLNTASPKLFLRSLATGLGEPAGADESLVLPKLAERIERAIEFRQLFDDLMESEAEGGATRESATQSWLAAWGEVGDEEDSQSGGPITAEAGTWPISSFVGYAEDNELKLSPSYQRADVWPTASAQQLIESILRGIPLPSVILLQKTELSKTVYEVVDGKQRLTSILRFVGRHPRAVSFVKQKAAAWAVPDLVSIFQTDYKRFKKLWRENESETLSETVARENYFPFPVRAGDIKPLIGMEQLKGKYFYEIRGELVNVVGEVRPVSSLFEKQTSKYLVPVIVYKTVSSDQIHEVFSLYNKQGKHLNSEEIRNALYHHLAYMRALLVTAGDSDDVADVAPFLVESWDELTSTAEVLDSYGFGRAGYKRTKLLSWVASSLVYSDGKAPSRSTAAHTNALLKRIEDDAADPLRDEDTVREVMVLLDRALDAHAAIPDEIWAPSFKNAQSKSKWQELQLVATLIAFVSAAFVLGDEFDDRLDGALEEIRSRSITWKRPGKTQTREQWKFIGRVAAELLDVLGVAHADADQLLSEAFGYSGLLALARLASEPDPAIVDGADSDV